MNAAPNSPTPAAQAACRACGLAQASSVALVLSDHLRIAEFGTRSGHVSRYR